MGAPAAFPVAEKDKWLQKFVKWSKPMAKKAQEFINRELPDGPWLGIHLRNGIDWVSLLHRNSSHACSFSVSRSVLVSMWKAYLI
jgi:hypothetical protein